MAELYPSVYVCHIFVIHSALDGWLDCFHMDTGVQISLRVPDFIPLGDMPRSDIAESHATSVFQFFEDPPYCFP